MIFFRTISAALIVMMLFSCATRQKVKEDIKVTVPPPPQEEIKLPELPPKKSAEAPVKKAEPVRVEKEAEEKYVILNFDGADIETVIATIGELLNINYILAPGVTGKVTIQSYRKFPVKDLFQIFQTILEVNGLTAVKDGTLYRIVPIDTAKQQPVSVQSGTELKLQLDSSFITQIIPLQYVKANDIVNVMRNLMPRGTDLIVYEPTNLLIVTAPPAGLVKFMKILEALDIPATDRESIRTFVYYVENGDAKKLAEALNKLYAEKKDKKVTPAPAPRTVTPAPTPAQPVRPATPTPATTTTIEGAPGEIEGEVVITPYEDINGIIIKASPANYLAILEVLKKIDIQVKQVLIEVLVAEVTLEDEDKFGIEWLLKARAGRSSTTLSGFTAGGLAADADLNPSITTDSGVPVLPSTRYFAYVVDPEKFAGLISAYSKAGKLNVIASPHVLAVDNKEAKIEIGTEVATASSIQQPGAGQPATSLTQLQYRTAGLLLTVTPHITEKGQVTLKISQEFSTVKEEETLGVPTPTFSTRKAITNAIIQSGHSLVIGGLISEQKDFTREGLPLLSKIPILGYLFGTTKEITTKKELLIMVTPRVISTRDEADEVTKDFQNKVKTVKKRLEDAGKIISLNKVTSKVATVYVEKDASLMEIVEASGYVLNDNDLNAFLSEFTALNEDMESINRIPEGSTVKLPLKYLKKTKK